MSDVKRARLENYSDDDDNDDNDLRGSIRKGLCSNWNNIKKQNAYLSPSDVDISFNDIKHEYLLHDKGEKFGISVTGFCKNEIHHNEFNPVKVLKNMKFDTDNDDMTIYEQQASKLIEWKYAALFGSMFHAVIEFFFENVVNKCTHENCKIQNFNSDIYRSCQLDETNNYNLSKGKCSQVLAINESLPIEPVMPCLKTLDLYSIFVEVVTSREFFDKFFIHSSSRFNVNESHHKRKFLETLELAFNKDGGGGDGRSGHRGASSSLYEKSIEEIIKSCFNIDKYYRDMDLYLFKFGSVLMHLPIKDCFDIRPEYVVFSEEHGIAGSVDLTMRRRANPRDLLIYDWKTSKNIYRSFGFGKNQTTQLKDYVCQLHTYANIILSRNTRYNIELYIVNITCADSCIYNTMDFLVCDCRDIFCKFNCNMIPIIENE